MRSGNYTFRVFMTLVCCGIIVGTAGAETANPASAPATQPASSPVRDPSEPDPALRRMLDNVRAATPGHPRSSAVMQVIRRGVVKLKGQPAQVLIEVTGGGSYIVHEGSEIGVSSNDGTTALRVKSVSRDEIIVEVGPARQTLIVR